MNDALIQIGGRHPGHGYFKSGPEKRPARLCLSCVRLRRGGAVACRSAAGIAALAMAARAGRRLAGAGAQLSAACAGDRSDLPAGGGYLPRSRLGRCGHGQRTVRPGPGTAAGSSAFAAAARFLCGLLAVILLTLAQPPSVHAQGLPVEAEALLNQEESALEDVGGWGLQDMLGWLAELLTQDLQKPIRFALRAAGYLLLAGLLALLAGGESWRQCMDAVSALGFGVLSLNAMMSLAGTVAAAAQDCQNYLIAFVPGFSGVAAMGGHTAGGMAYSGMFFSKIGRASCRDRVGIWARSGAYRQRVKYDAR